MKKITNKNIFIKLYNAKEKHWLKTILISGFSGTISFTSSTIIKLANIDTNSPLGIFFNVTSLVLFWIFFIATILIQISNVVYAKYLKSIDKNNEKDLNFNLKLISNINNVCNEKLNTLIEVISNVKSDIIKPPPIINKPCNQLRNISIAISDTIDYVLNGSNVNNNGEKDVKVNIFYSLPDELDKNWKMSDSQNFDYESISEIVDNKDSLFNLALNERSDIIMRNNKKEALSEQHYVPCNADMNGDTKLNGSILYYKMPVKDNHGKTIVKIVIMVYTCRKKFAKEDSEAIKNAKYNIETVLLRFKPRIQIEMCLLYLHHLNALFEHTKSK